MIPDPELERFYRVRTSLFVDLDRLRERVERWFAEKATAPSMSDLGFLEGLLTEKQAVLEKLATAEREMMNYLIRRRQQPID